jgi:hypothetical protein
MQLLAERMRRIDLRCMRDFRPNEANAIDYRRHVCGNTYTAHGCHVTIGPHPSLTRTYSGARTHARANADTQTPSLTHAVRPRARCYGRYAPPFGSLLRSIPLHSFGIRILPCLRPQRVVSSQRLGVIGRALGHHLAPHCDDRQLSGKVVSTSTGHRAVLAVLGGTGRYSRYWADSNGVRRCSAALRLR